MSKEEIIKQYLSEKNKEVVRKRNAGKSKDQISEEMRALVRKRWDKKKQA